MDVQNTYGPHIQRVCDKATQRIATLTKIMPNMGGPSSCRRQIYCGVVHSIILYGAPVWRKVIRIGRYKQMMISTQRKVLLRAAMAYRTVSAQALQVITGTPPIDLLVEERGRIHEREDGSTMTAKKEERERTLSLWQRRWEEEVRVAERTRTLIPHLKEWYECSHRRLNYHLSQFLTGHGSFRVYTNRIGKAHDDICTYCGERDTAEHTVMRCPRWERMRWETPWWNSELDGASLVTDMVRDKQKWLMAEKIIRKIMENKEREERRGQQEEN